MCSVWVVFDVLSCSIWDYNLLIFYSFEPYLYPYAYPYSYAYPIILTLKIYQSFVLEVVQLFPLASWFRSSLWLKSVSDFAHP